MRVIYTLEKTIFQKKMLNAKNARGRFGWETVKKYKKNYRLLEML